MTDAQIKIEILRLPIATVLGAYAQYGSGQLTGPADKQKGQAADYLTSCIRANGLTLNDIRNAAPVKPITTAPSVDVSAITAVANRAEASALDAHAALDYVRLTLRDLNNNINIETDARRTGLDEVKDALSKLDHKVGQVSIDDMAKGGDARFNGHRVLDSCQQMWILIKSYSFVYRDLDLSISYLS